MLELDEQIRTLIDESAPPVTAEEIRNEALDSKDPVRTWPQKRSVRRRRLAVAGSVAALALGAGLVLSLLLPTSSTPQRSILDSRTILSQAAQVADAQRPLVPAPGQYLYVRTMVGSAESDAFTPGKRMSKFYVQEMFETWTAPNAQPVEQGLVVGQPQFVTTADRAAWAAAGSPPIKSGYSQNEGPPYYDVANLPTDPAKMEAYFTAQSYLPVNPRTGRDSVWQFSTALEFLQAGASSTQRGALLKFMEALPGVRAAGPSVSMGTHLKGQTLELPADHPGLKIVAILDPRTSELIEVRYVVTDSSLFQQVPSVEQVNTDRAVPPWQDGQATEYVDFLYSGIADSAGRSPSSAPPAPPGWSWGTPRMPLPGSAYP